MVQAVRLSHHDAEETLVFVLDPFSSGYELNRAADRSKRVAYFMGDARGQLPDGSQTVCPLQTLLHPLDPGEILEIDQHSGPFRGGAQQRRAAETDDQRPAITGFVLEFSPFYVGDMRSVVAKAGNEVEQASVVGILLCYSGHRFRIAVEDPDPSFAGYGRQATVKIRHNGTVEALKFLEINDFLLELRLAAPRPLGEIAGEQRREVKGEEIDEQGVEDIDRAILQGGNGTQADGGQPAVVLEVDDRAVEDGTERSRVQGLAACDKNARVRDGEQVEKRKRTTNTSGEDDQNRDEQDIPGNLDVGQGLAVALDYPYKKE